MMHIKPEASAYMENVWLWVADHDNDDADLTNDNNTMPQTSIYVARGLLVESRQATWLYGTSSEHAVFYQYAFQGAKNVIAGMIQTESPYFQPNPMPPSPYQDTVGKFPGDPVYSRSSQVSSGHDASWAVTIAESSDLIIAGAGLYSWYSNYEQSCVGSFKCQKSLIKSAKNGPGVRMFNVVTIGAELMISHDDGDILAADNLAVGFYPKWSYITVFDPSPLAAADTKKPVCKPRDNSGISIPDGRYAEASAPKQQGFFTLVNGTPYNWRLTYNHSYQMYNWKWHDVPAGIVVSLFLINLLKHCR
jgi:hypothetical protein